MKTINKNISQMLSQNESECLRLVKPAVRTREMLAGEAMLSVGFGIERIFYLFVSACGAAASGTCYFSGWVL